MVVRFELDQKIGRELWVEVVTMVTEALRVDLEALTM